ncbi:MAG: bifunctional folylpolyglutamate synthase/dihydrofolate synthase [Candidatus Binatia bacterium]
MAASDYQRVLAWLYAREAAKGMDFKLERVALALRNLGDPQQRFAAVHIAGTNGKGSVAAMLHAICHAAGFRVGLYTSPHLVSFTERIRVGTASISEAEVVDLAREVYSAAIVRGIDLTFFELVTVMAFLHFARREVDLAVVEVGLGGRLDATNVLDPLVAVITTIGLDHEDFLGDTLASVAREKAGIIKPQRPVIVGTVPEEAQQVLQQVVAERGASADWFGVDFSASGASALRFRGFGCELADIVLPLRGAFQRDNAAVAIAAAMRLRERLPISDAAVRQGLAKLQWPGRLDVVETQPLIVLDGAHNADGIATLVKELPAVVSTRTVHLLFGVMRDKRWQAMVDAILPAVSSATLTTVLPPRGEAPEVLARAFQPYCPVLVAADPVQGLEALRGSAGAGDAIVVTGSLYLVGAVYAGCLRLPGSLISGASPTTLRL